MTGEASKAGLAKVLSGIIAAASVNLSPRLRQTISELSQLETDWGGEDTRPIKPHVLADVVEMLSRLKKAFQEFKDPYLVPTFDGYVQLEWHRNPRSLDVEAVQAGWKMTGTLITSAGERQYFYSECQKTEFAVIEKFYGWFAGIEPLWPSL